jgi:hypothetical protein
MQFGDGYFYENRLHKFWEELVIINNLRRERLRPR